MDPFELPTFGSDDGSLFPGFSGTYSDLHHPQQPVSHHFSDLSTWIDTLVPEPISHPTVPVPVPVPVPEPSYPTHFLPGPSSSHQVPVLANTWTDPISGIVPVVRQTTQEDYGIKLVHTLVTCAEAIQRGQTQLAAILLDQMTNRLMPHVNTDAGIGKVASYFIQALTRRLLYNPAQEFGSFSSGADYNVLYHHFYEACPYLKFSHFVANQAIMNAFNGHDYVQVIDFSLIQGLQWPALIQALAHRPGGPPVLKITGIGSSNSLVGVGSKLAELAGNNKIRFIFRAVDSTQLEDIMLEANPNEVIAVNSIFQMHKLLGSDIIRVLNCIRMLNPKIVCLVEQEVNHNQAEFLSRFTQALFYYSAMFDSLESCPVGPDKSLAELYLQKEISNILCCEGLDRIERHETLGQWRVRMDRAGFRQLGLDRKAYDQASMLLGMFSAEGYDVEEREGCLRLGWHRRPLITASTWQVGRISHRYNVSPSVIISGSSSSSSSS